MVVLVVDPYPLLRAGLKELLLSLDTSVEVTEAGTLEEMEALLGQRGDVETVFTEILSTPHPGGNPHVDLEVERVLHLPGAWPGRAFAAVSAEAGRGLASRAYALGFAGFLPKELPLDAMAAACRQILQGQSYFPRQAAADRRTACAKAVGEDCAPFQKLTSRQQEVLRLIEEGRSNHQIAAHLGIAANTVRTHVSGILHRLDVPNRAVAAAIARRALAPAPKKRCPPTPSILMSA